MKRIIAFTLCALSLNITASHTKIPVPSEEQLLIGAQKLYKHLKPQLDALGLTDEEAALRSYKSILKRTAASLTAMGIHPARATAEQANIFWKPFNGSKYGKHIINRTAITTKDRNPQTLLKLLYQTK